MAAKKNYWLVKNEPKECSFDELKDRPKSTGYWTGVRNYQARNFIRDVMQKGDLSFYYHSNCEEPGIAGVVEILKAGYPDPNQFDKKHRYYDEKSRKEDPRWFSFDVKWKKKAKTFKTCNILQHQGGTGAAARAQRHLLQSVHGPTGGRESP